jgi:hypothetical protein
MFEMSSDKKKRTSVFIFFSKIQRFPVFLTDKESTRNLNFQPEQIKTLAAQ